MADHAIMERSEDLEEFFPGADVAHIRVDDGEAALGPRMAWRTAAVLFWFAGAGAVVQLKADWISPFVVNSNVTVAVGSIAMVFGCLWWAMGELEVSPAWLEIPVLLSYVIFLVMFANMPEVEYQLGVIYLMPLIFVALFMSSRSLVLYVALSVVLILQASVRHVGDEFGLVPGLLTIVALASSAGLTFYVRLELKRIEELAASLSDRDALTGLANLRPLYERVERGIHEAERTGEGITVIMLDLDGFKRVNDEYSHSVGDETLRVVARAIADTVRRDELVARRGGDEFAVVTGATEPEEIQTLIRRIRHNVSDARVDILPAVRSGVTFGHATRQEGDTVGRLLARADRELHDAKARVKLERWSWRQRRLQDLADEIEDPGL